MTEQESPELMETENYQEDDGMHPLDHKGPDFFNNPNTRKPDVNRDNKPGNMGSRSGNGMTEDRNDGRKKKLSENRIPKAPSNNPRDRQTESERGMISDWLVPKHGSEGTKQSRRHMEQPKGTRNGSSHPYKHQSHQRGGTQATTNVPVHGCSDSFSQGFGSGSLHGNDQNARKQMDMQMFRSEQASKQMLYSVFSNAVGALEQLEERESGQKMQRSNVQYADLSRRSDHDVKSQVDTQVLLLETQTRNCNTAIKEEAREVLKQITLMWISERQGRRPSMIDEYAKKIFQVLSEGKTVHPKEFYQPLDISDEELLQVVTMIGKGDQDRKKMDKEFRDNPAKQACKPEVRGYSVSMGAKRMAECYPEMAQHLDPYILPDLR